MLSGAVSHNVGESRHSLHFLFVFEPSLLNFLIFLIPARLKKEEKISYQWCIFCLLQISLFKTKNALKMKGVVTSRLANFSFKGVEQQSLPQEKVSLLL